MKFVNALMTAALFMGANMGLAEKVRYNDDDGQETYSLTKLNGFPTGFSLSYARTYSLPLRAYSKLKKVRIQAEGSNGWAAFDLIVNGEVETDAHAVPPNDPPFEFHVGQNTSSLEITAVRAKELPLGSKHGTLVIRDIRVWVDEPGRDESNLDDVYEQPKKGCRHCPSHPGRFRSAEAAAVWAIFEKLEKMEEWVDNEAETLYVDPAIKAAIGAFTVLQNRSPSHPLSIEALDNLRDFLENMCGLLENQAEVDSLRRMALEMQIMIEEIESFRN